MLNHKLKLVTLIFSLILIMRMVACADSIDDQNDAFRVVIEELQNRVTVLESMRIGESHLIYPQQWATGAGTVGDPWADDCIKKALDFAPTGGTIFLKAGYYQMAFNRY